MISNQKGEAQLIFQLSSINFAESMIGHNWDVISKSLGGCILINLPYVAILAFDCNFNKVKYSLS